MRRWLKRIGLVVASLLCVLAALAWYVSGLPWRNRCGDPPIQPPSANAPLNSAVATSQPLATKAAADVLTEGGSAADAAIAAALMLTVAEPGNSGLGGGGFALVHDPKTDSDVALDFRERAPLDLDLAELKAAVKANSNALRTDHWRSRSPRSGKDCSSSTIATGDSLSLAWRRPAIAAARAGVEIGREYSARCWFRFSALRGDSDARRTFMTSAGSLCPLPGWTLHQPELAETLTALSNDPGSWDERVGKKMVSFLRDKGSRMSTRDLEATRVVERPVVSGHFHGKRIVSMGPPSSGGILVVGLLQTYEKMRERLPRANALHLWTEASRLVFYDRARLLGDPDFVTVPVDRLISDTYALSQAERVSEATPLALPTDAALHEGTHTTTSR